MVFALHLMNAFTTTVRVRITVRVGDSIMQCGVKTEETLLQAVFLVTKTKPHKAVNAIRPWLTGQYKPHIGRTVHTGHTPAVVNHAPASHSQKMSNRYDIR